MNVEIKDFIAVYTDAFTPEFCDDVIKYYDSAEKSGLIRTRFEDEGVPKEFKDGSLCRLTSEDHIIAYDSQYLQQHFNDKLFNVYYKHYAEEFFPLQREVVYNFCFKIQKTKIGGGYHVWHYEAAGQGLSVRQLVWMLYLNDVEEGGETEYLYQKIRVKPKKGTLVIWPAGFTHTHRGNPPYSNEKYTATGWLIV